MLPCKSLKQSLLFNNTKLYCSKLMDKGSVQPMANSCNCAQRKSLTQSLNIYSPCPYVEKRVVQLISLLRDYCALWVGLGFSSCNGQVFCLSVSVCLS